MKLGEDRKSFSGVLSTPSSRPVPSTALSLSYSAPFCSQRFLRKEAGRISRRQFTPLLPFNMRHLHNAALHNDNEGSCKNARPFTINCDRI